MGHMKKASHVVGVMKILFVCQGNINRSQMARAMLSRARPDIDVSAAGTIVERAHEGRPIADLESWDQYDERDRF